VSRRLTVLLFLQLFVLLTAYYLVKVAREPLILVGGGAEVKSYAAAAMAILLMVVVPVYGRAGSRARRDALLGGLTIVFVACLVVFYALGRAGVPVGVPFFLWVGIFNLLAISQFWALANDVCAPGQGRRAFSIVALGGVAGAIAGAEGAGRLVRAFGPYPLMLAAAGLLLVAAAIGWIVSRIDLATGHGREHGGEPLAPSGGFELVLRDRYLLVIAVMVLVYNLVNTTGEYILSRTVIAHAAGDPAARERAIGAFYGDFFSWVNGIAAAMQLVIVPVVLRRFGPRAALLGLPLVALAGYSALAIAPVLSVVKGIKVFENATDYSLENTAKQALFLRVGRAAKYKAKAAIDTFFVRLGDVLSAVLVFGGVHAGLAPAGFALVNLVLVGVWIALVVLLMTRRGEWLPAGDSIIEGAGETAGASRP
jgi:AAA family ATP:ADP antiporter